MPKRATGGNAGTPPKKKGKIGTGVLLQSEEDTNGSVQGVVGSSAKSPPRTPEKKHPVVRPTPPSPIYVPSFVGDGWTHTRECLRLPNGRYATSEQLVFEHCQSIQDRGH